MAGHGSPLARLPAPWESGERGCDAMGWRKKDRTAFQRQLASVPSEVTPLPSGFLGAASPCSGPAALQLCWCSPRSVPAGSSPASDAALCTEFPPASLKADGLRLFCLTRCSGGPRGSGPAVNGRWPVPRPGRTAVSVLWGCTPIFQVSAPVPCWPRSPLLNPLPQFT